MHENTPYFLIFPFFESFRGGGCPSAPPPNDAASERDMHFEFMSSKLNLSTQGKYATVDIYGML